MSLIETEVVIFEERRTGTIYINRKDDFVEHVNNKDKEIQKLKQEIQKLKYIIQLNYLEIAGLNHRI